MSQDKPNETRRVSRRDFILVTAVGSAAMIGASLPASEAFASNKRTQKAVSYRPTPNGHQRCDNCVNFQAPSSCKQVEGAIAPAGWCVLYAAK